MISVAPTLVTRNPDFVVAVDTAPSPYMVGVLDAERCELCVPEMYFVWDGDICEYCEGYESVSGVTLTTRHFLGGDN